ncbi:hypothetical protein MY04_0674 [Flammeovirga sp. MY04]|uniref:hypothetical protein n=1 Tax=Flammeovirga sp. MY04 TaxID=1191459 RepID=UPI0008063593|nr:hypothetical protein [Flammeovirga sp. MY04]ANQ48056.1 hypothetical protein MY04_0674 [Flammeovirga sp. MY04]
MIKVKHFPKDIGSTTLEASLFSHLHFDLKNEVFKKFFSVYSQNDIDYFEKCYLEGKDR